MTHYLLDTNICLYLENPDSPYHHQVRTRFERLDDSDEIYISVLSLYELHYGVQCRVQEGAQKLAAQAQLFIEDILGKFEILTISVEGAAAFAKLKVGLKAHSPSGEGQKQNIKKHDIDIMIAGNAVAKGLVMVSNDQIFPALQQLEPELEVENWAR